jgi:hypothetical protein
MEEAEIRSFMGTGSKTGKLATVRADGSPHLARATETSRRYVGDDRAGEYGARNGVDGELIVWVTPTRMVGEADIAH